MSFTMICVHQLPNISVDVEIAKSDTEAVAVICHSNLVEATNHKGVGMSMTC